MGRKVAHYSSAYLKMKMKSMSSMQKVATLSMVFISTTSCLLRAGRKRTSFRTRSKRKVRSTDNPPSAWPIISHTLRSRRSRRWNATGRDVLAVPRGLTSRGKKKWIDVLRIT